ncbi:hypothetical protein [Streptomyces sp. 6N106]
MISTTLRHLLRRGGDEIAQVVRSIKDLAAVVRQTEPEDRVEI